jgi:hypothetical protein
MPSKICIICGKEYYKKSTCGKPEWSRRKYCSIQCQHKGLIVRPLYYNCQVCGKKFKRHSCQVNPKFCSNKCAGKFRKGKKRPKFSKEWIENLSKSHKGVQAKEKHPKWKGGITKKNHLERNRFRDEVQKQVFERDNYTCQMCDVRGGILHVDHIQSWSEYPDLRFDINNCRTLCNKCHYKITFGKEMPEEAIYWGNHIKT